MDEIDLDDIERRMDGATEVLSREFGGLRTGRASASLLDGLPSVKRLLSATQTSCGVGLLSADGDEAASPR